MSRGTKRPASEILPAAEELVRVLAPFCERIEIAGSLRRQAREVSDIEIVAIPKIEPVEIKDPADLFDHRQTEKQNRLWGALDGMLKGHYVRAGEKYRAFICPNETVQVDLFTAEPGNWGLIQLIRTGSAEFSKHVVTVLGKLQRPSFDGWVRRALTPWPWTDDEKARMERLQTPTEEKVFELAEIPYREPHQRH